MSEYDLTRVGWCVCECVDTCVARTLTRGLFVSGNLFYFGGVRRCYGATVCKAGISARHM